MLYLISWLTDFALVLFVFAGTRALAERDASPVLLGVLGASFFLASALGNAWSGQLADRIGRRKVALSGSALLIASLSIITASDTDSVWFYVSYTLVGVAVGHVYPPVMAWLGHNRSGHSARRAYLLFCLSFNFGMLSGQLSGGWLFERIGTRAPLLVAIGLTVAGFLCLLWHRDEGADRPLAKPDRPEAADARLARAFSRLHWISNFGGMFSMSILWFLFPILVVHLGVPATQHGLVLGVGRAVVISTYCIMYFLPGWQFRFRFAVIAQVVGAVGLIVISQSESAVPLACGVAALSGLMGYNYFASLFYSARGNSAERKGRAFGLNEAFLGLGAAGGSVAGGFASADLGIRTPFEIAAVLVATLLVVQSALYWKLVTPLREHDSNSDLVEQQPGIEAT